MTSGPTYSLVLTMCAALAVSLPPYASQAQESAKPSVDADGTITGDIGPVPLSGFLSDAAKARWIELLHNSEMPNMADGVEAVRESSAERAKESLDEWLEIYPATIDETSINGVAVDIVTPKAGIAPGNANRVLINAHMGGFFTGGKYGGQLEAVPLAGFAGVKVYAVDYRMAPEHIFPAASEDMEVIYRHVLETTPPENIGLYGCSAGGTLTGQMIPWLQAKGLPLPGAISIQCAGINDSFWFGGDSGRVSMLLNGQPSQLPARPDNAPRDYFDGIDKNDPLISPGEFPEVLTQYPPTLVVTGTRDISMSNALVTHSRLIAAGVRAELYVQEGLGHGHFFTFPGAPESAVAYTAIWDFFDRTLGR